MLFLIEHRCNAKTKDKNQVWWHPVDLTADVLYCFSLSTMKNIWRLHRCNLCNVMRNSVNLREPASAALYLSADHQKLEREARICRLLKHPNIGEFLWGGEQMYRLTYGAFESRYPITHADILVGSLLDCECVKFLCASRVFSPHSH